MTARLILRHPPSFAQQNYRGIQIRANMLDGPIVGFANSGHDD